MLRAMIQLASKARGAPPGGLPTAVAELRGLAEFPEAGERAYVVRRDGSGAVTARAIEVDETSRYGFAFRRPAGPRSPQVGPVLKRALDPKKGVAPNGTTLAATLAHFGALSASKGAVATVYRAALESLGPGDVAARTARLVSALEEIPEKKTVFVALGDPPGVDPVYADHLLSVIRTDLYGIDDEAPTGPCPVCRRVAQLGRGALKGAKVNFLNGDNLGVFPGFDSDRAADRFALCAACADAIASTYINLKSKLRVVIAGTPALVLPYIVAPDGEGERMPAAWDAVLQARGPKDPRASEDELLAAIAKESALASFHVLWASMGDSLEDVTGFIASVPCARLRTLAAHNEIANTWVGGVLPTRRVRPFDLHLSLVGELLHHPGGKRTERRNNVRLAALRQRVAQAVYLGEPLDPAPLLAEVREIIADHLVDPTISERFAAMNLTREAPPPKRAGADLQLNAASWIRHVALLFHALRELEVLPPMSNGARYTPRSARLRKLLSPPSGVDTDAKMFAFALGLLFGRLLALQAVRGVNTRSNALTWLRRATLTGADLPGLYVRMRERLAAYDAERSAPLRELVFDASELGKRLGSEIPLDADTAMYFLFLGQSLAGEVFAKDDAVAPEESE